MTNLEWRIRFKTKKVSDTEWSVIEESTGQVVDADSSTYDEAQQKADAHNRALVEKRFKKS